ncbi:hypothetical protein GGI20_006079 [Coemansia sp. BCRC 34301]|nr:hypothetical protein GGI20_006079 [Coemansia sp. BCRC 34301]
MVRHSKNNTASGVFTYAERQMVDYGTKSKRLGGDSKRAFDACYLCLKMAVVPVVCGKGHISCKECVLQSILEQKQAIERAKHEYAAFQKQEAREMAERQKERDDAEVQQYLEREVGLSAKRQQTEEEKAGGKKLKLLEYRGEAGAGSGELVTKPKLPSFWIPSLAPSAKRMAPDPSALSVQCQAASPAHLLKLKHLVEVRFRASSAGEKLCPSCDKPLLNSTKIGVLARCGHAVCQRCVSNFVLTAGDSGSCVVCQKKVAVADVIHIESEGTGFTGGGGRMVATRYGSALQA